MFFTKWTKNIDLLLILTRKVVVMSSLTLYLLIVVSDVKERARESANKKIFEHSLNIFITNVMDFVNI